MATLSQFQFFKSVYDEETQRYSLLATRAQLYFAIISLYLGAFVFKIKEISEFAVAFKVPMWAFAFAGALASFAFLFTVLAIRIRKYEVPCDLRQIVDGFGSNPPRDEDFFDDRLADYVVATERNFEVNNKVAGCLEFSVWFIFGSALWVFLVTVYSLRCSL